MDIGERKKAIIIKNRTSDSRGGNLHVQNSHGFHHFMQSFRRNPTDLHLWTKFQTLFYYFFAVVFFNVPLSQPSQRVMYVSPPYLSLGIFSLCTPTQADGRGRYRDGGNVEPKKTTAKKAWVSSNIFPLLSYTVQYILVWLLER